MSVTADTGLLALGGSGALLVVAGVVGKNSSEQTWSGRLHKAEPFFVLLFVVGWVLVAAALGRDRGCSVQAAVWLSAAAVAFSVVAMKDKAKKGEPVRPILPALFALAWLGIGFVSSSQLPGCAKLWGVLASALVLASMLWLLPWQRQQCVVDGPGMPMFVSAWVLIVAANAVRSTGEM